MGVIGRWKTKDEHPLELIIHNNINIVGGMMEAGIKPSTSLFFHPLTF